MLCERSILCILLIRTLNVIVILNNISTILEKINSQLNSQFSLRPF